MRRFAVLLGVALVWLGLISAAPVPPALPPAVIRIPAPGPVVVVRSALQACTFQNATTRLREVVFDGRGYPYGEVAAWSCGSASTALDEFTTRKAAMQAEALERYP